MHDLLAQAGKGDMRIIDRDTGFELCRMKDMSEVEDGSIEVIGQEIDEVEETTIYQPDPSTLVFMLGELPFVTGLYERARAELAPRSRRSAPRLPSYVP